MNLLVLVEDLHPNESVKDQSVQMLRIISEYMTTSKIKYEGDDKLIDCLTKNHFPHIDSD